MGRYVPEQREHTGKDDRSVLGEIPDDLLNIIIDAIIKNREEKAGAD